jgi:hypothetical protein
MAEAAVAAPPVSCGVSLGQRILVLLELFVLHMRDGDNAIVPLAQWRQVLLLAHTKRGEAGVLTEVRGGCSYYDHVAAVLAQWTSLLGPDVDSRECARFAVLVLDFSPGHICDALLQQVRARSCSCARAVCAMLCVYADILVLSFC